MIVDIVVGGVLLLSGLLALSMGMVKFVLLIASWLGAALTTLYGYSYLKPVFAEFIKESLIVEIASAATLFLVSLVVLTIITHLIANKVRGSVLGHLDRALGFVFGLFLGMTLISMIYLITSSFFWNEDDPPEQIAEAKTLPIVKVGARILVSALPEGIFESVDRDDNALDNAVEGVQDAVKDMGQKKIDQLGDTIESIEAEERLNKLIKPEPAEPETPAEQGNSEDPAYGDEERRDMQRLIESNQ